MGVMRRVSTSRKPVSKRTVKPKALESKGKLKVPRIKGKVKMSEPTALLLKKQISKLNSKFKPIARKYPEAKKPFELVSRVYLNSEISTLSARVKGDKIKGALVENLAGDHKHFSKSVNKFINDPNRNIFDVISLERRALEYLKKYKQVAGILDKS